MAHQKLNVGIGLALAIAVIAVVVLMFLPSQSVQAPTTPEPANDTASSSADNEVVAPPNVIPPAQYKDIIRVSEPLPESTITSPLTIRGEARGQWFFEATFPIVLTNWDGLIIAEGFASADGDWMTEDYVPFTAELTFVPDTGVSNRATLILQKDNPSGLPENDDAFEYTLYFAS